jgi:hypothetical protein
VRGSIAGVRALLRRVFGAAVLAVLKDDRDLQDLVVLRHA